MASISASGSRNFPEGYRTVPVFDSDRQSPLRLCVVVRDVSDPGAGVFVRLRDAGDATIHLGCLVDAGGCVHEWVELWIQSVDRLGAAPEAAREVLTNALLDERWKRRAALFGRMDPAGKIEIEAEHAHPLPIWFDLAVTCPVRPASGGTPWALCMDDQLLEASGLPPYHASLARYLSAGGKLPFVPATAEAPENKATQAAAAAFPDLLPFNPDGGLMMIRKLAPLGFEAFLGLLGGSAWKGIEEAGRFFPLNGAYAALTDPGVVRSGAGHLFLAGRGSAGRLVEVFHLKLGLLAQALSLVVESAREEQLPFLNLSAESFRVRLAETGAGLPCLWTALVTLALPGAAVPLPAPPGAGRRWLAPANERSVFRPADLPAAICATGEVRLANLAAGPDGMHTIEGTLLAQEKIGTSNNSLLWLRLPLPMGRLDFFSTLTGETAPGCHGFRTLPKRLDQHQQAALESAKMGSLADVSFETLPHLGAAVDLYALGVLGVRSLLVNDETALPTALEDIFAFARTIPAGPVEKLAERIRAASQADPRWQQALGSHRLLNRGAVSQQEAAAYIPPELWWDAVALLIQWFPGLIPESFCPGLDATPADPVESVFEPAARALHRLEVRSRSLLFSDWKYAAEVNAVLREALKRQPKAPPRPAAGVKQRSR